MEANSKEVSKDIFYKWDENAFFLEYFSVTPVTHLLFFYK